MLKMALNIVSLGCGIGAVGPIPSIPRISARCCYVRHWPNAQLLHWYGH